NPVPIWKQTCGLRADTPIDHISNDLRPAFDTARPDRGAVSERNLIMKLKELCSRTGIQGDHGSLSVLIPDEHDSVANAQRPKGLPMPQSALDSIVRRSLPQDLPRAGIDGVNHAIDGLESFTIAEDGDAIGTHVGWRIHQRPQLDRAAGGTLQEAGGPANSVGVRIGIGVAGDPIEQIRTRERQILIWWSRVIDRRRCIAF